MCVCRFYGPRMQEDAFWSILEHFWAKIGWCKHGDMRMDVLGFCVCKCVCVIARINTCKEAHMQTQGKRGRKPKRTQSPHPPFTITHLYPSTTIIYHSSIKPHLVPLQREEEGSWTCLPFKLDCWSVFRCFLSFVFNV